MRYCAKMPLIRRIVPTRRFGAGFVAHTKNVVSDGAAQRDFGMSALTTVICRQRRILMPPSASLETRRYASRRMTKNDDVHRTKKCNFALENAHYVGTQQALYRWIACALAGWADNRKFEKSARPASAPVEKGGPQRCLAAVDAGRRNPGENDIRAH